MLGVCVAKLVSKQRATSTTKPPAFYTMSPNAQAPPSNFRITTFSTLCVGTRLKI
jgi:hypothetical protein